MQGIQKTESEQEHQLLATLCEMDHVVFKGYLENITEYPVVPLDVELSRAVQKIRLRKVSTIVYDRHEDTFGKFNSVFSSIHSCNSSLVLIIKGSKEHAEIFIGTHMISDEPNVAIETLEAAFKGNFPGIDVSQNLENDEITALLESIQDPQLTAVASVSGVPSLKNDETNSFSQGLEKIIDGMRGREYFAVIQASPVSLRELEHVQAAYEDIYSILSAFEQKQISLSKNDSRTIGVSLTDGITKTLSKSIGETLTNTLGTSHSASTSSSKTRSAFDIKRALSQAATGALSGGVAAGAVTGGLTAPVGTLIGAITGFGVGLFGGSDSETESSSQSTSQSTSSATSNTNTTSEAINNSRTDSETTTVGSGKSIQITEKNRRITTLLTSIDNQLNRIDECKNYGMWSWGAYFIGKEELEVKLGADLYSGVLRGESTGLERNNIAVWNGALAEKYSTEEKNYSHLKQYISQLKHPIFETPPHFFTKEVSHTSLISTKEVAVVMSLPHKSLPGVPIIDSVAFGRSVTRISSNTLNKSIRIGSISNFGKVDKNYAVEIDIDSLTGHTFVTGSTGAGKSNAVYSILDTLYTEHKIPFLIIEPAKGEYKNVFGGRDNVHVFGTNPKLTNLLRINPFSFPDDIHVMEHIDRLIEILNAVWPMYAAMPAILKEAVELAYEKMGWDLLNSVCKYGAGVFPDFYELLEVLPEIINKSDYSQEIKGNYAGALITRVRSLTNGYFKTIFQKNELTPSVLFDDACIVDLSRVGSSETKALLMGILFLKLQEYRISKANELNAGLRHITVLEEAHNLLRKSSITQNQDSTNLQGKSVEMISNAIAEMRTYGEGFIIADQAPGLLDQSVIRNTNTKIILRLPDFDDRNLVGKAARLSLEQIDEIARLHTGCSAIYQNNWLEPVLCQFNEFNKLEKYSYNSDTNNLIDLRKKSLTDIVKYLVRISLDQPDNKFEKPLELPDTGIYFPSTQEKNITTKSELQLTLLSIINFDRVINVVPKISNPDMWFKCLVNEVYRLLNTCSLEKEERVELIRLLLDSLLADKPSNKIAFDGMINEFKKSDGLIL